MNSTLNKTPSIEERLRKLLAEARKDQLEHEKAMEDILMRSKRMSAALESLFGWTEPEDQLPETAFATILSPLETLDVKKIVSKGDNTVNPAEDDQLPENLESKMDTSVDHSEAYDQRTKDAPEETAFMTTLSPLETFEVKKVVSKGYNVVMPEDTFPEPVRMSMVPTMAEKGRSRHGAGSVNATMSVQDGVLRGSSRDAGRHQSAHSATAMSLLEAVLVKGVASGEPETARDFVVAAVFADGYPRGSVGAMKHMHDRWKWRWKLPVLPN